MLPKSSPSTMIQTVARFVASKLLHFFLPEPSFRAMSPHPPPTLTISSTSRPLPKLAFHNETMNAVDVQANCAFDLAACASQLSNPTCTSSFGGCRDNTEGRLLDFSSSVVRTAFTPFDEDMRKEACWTRGLDNTFIPLNGGNDENLESTIKWQYFGTPHGFYRIYPGVPQQDCNSCALARFF